ncbi:MAG TPA: hypothetical protein VFZ22_09020 [Pyrinomonadaceae bacterium]|nr:hypothetical protein [Pyrinomonadaceae bacterium]
MRNFQLSALMLIVALTFSQRHAQGQQTTPAKDVQSVNSELREKAFSVLVSLAGQLNTLQSAENRARIGANIADSLWSHDETRARALFKLVQDDIQLHLTIPDGQDRDELNTFMVFLKLRSDTIERIAKRDPEMAYAFFNDTRVDLIKLPPYMVDNERNLDLRLSRQLVTQSPEIAVKLARESLARGLSEEVFEVLVRLNRKNQEQSLVLYRAIIEKMRTIDFREDWQARQYAYGLAVNFKPPRIDESAFRELIGLLVSRALENGCDRAEAERDDQLCRWVVPIVAGVNTSDPRAARLKQRPSKVDAAEEFPEALLDLNETAEGGTVDDILALAAKYPENVDDIYWRAMLKARQSGDLEKMRKIVSDFPGSPERRQQMLEEVERIRRASVIDEEKLTEFRRSLEATPRLQDRIQMLTFAAYRFGTNDHKRALKFLNEAEQLIDTMKPGKDQAEARIILAIVYCVEKDDRGFTIMESMMPTLNGLVDAAVKLDGYDTSYLREGEWNMSAAGGIGELLTRLSESAQIFAGSDFDRALSLAAQFERPEIRIMAQVKLAQGVLAGPHQRVITRY